MKPVADYLGTLMGKPVLFAEDCVGEPAEKAAGKEVEPKLIYGLLLIKSRQNKQRDDAMITAIPAAQRC